MSDILVYLRFVGLAACLASLCYLVLFGVGALIEAVVIWHRPQRKLPPGYYRFERGKIVIDIRDF